MESLITVTAVRIASGIAVALYSALPVAGLNYRITDETEGEDLTEDLNLVLAELTPESAGKYTIHAPDGTACSGDDYLTTRDAINEGGLFVNQVMQVYRAAQVTAAEEEAAAIAAGEQFEPVDEV